MSAMRPCLNSTISAVFWDFGGKIHVSLTPELHVKICKTLKFQRFISKTIFRTALSTCENNKKLHHFAQNMQKWWSFCGNRKTLHALSRHSAASDDTCNQHNRQHYCQSHQNNRRNDGIPVAVHSFKLFGRNALCQAV